MHNSTCACGGSCSVAMVMRVLLIIGGVNWGLVGLGMLLNSKLNIVNLILGSVPTLEAIVYLLVGVAAVMSIFGCRCKKCSVRCANCTCAVDAPASTNMGGTM